MSNPATSSRWIYLAALIFAGESIYMLPYMRKTFQTSMEAAFGVSAAELGTINAMFGLLALVSYLPGGWLADRVPVRYLLSFSLVSTGVGGLYMLSMPGYAGLLLVHAFWGVTSILTFWAALIKATREWGGAHEQGRGFGLLDGGRGVVAALLASLATIVFTQAPNPVQGLRAVLWVYSLAPLVAGGLVWFALPARLAVETARRHSGSPRLDRLNMTPGWMRVKRALRRVEVWLLAVIIFAAYWLYLGSFSFPAFVERAYGESKSFAAVLGTFRDWLRPLAAIGAGVLADRLRPSRVIAAAFVVLLFGYASLAVLPPQGGSLLLLWLQVAAVALAVFALRGIYYALLEEGGVPHHLTGISVGIVSVVGFMPDIFAFMISGWFEQVAPGALGYRGYYALLCGVSLVGLVAAGALARRVAGRNSYL